MILVKKKKEKKFSRITFGCRKQQPKWSTNDCEFEKAY